MFNEEEYKKMFKEAVEIIFEDVMSNIISPKGKIIVQNVTALHLNHMLNDTVELKFKIDLTIPVIIPEKNSIDVLGFSVREVFEKLKWLII